MYSFTVVSARMVTVAALASVVLLAESASAQYNGAYYAPAPGTVPLGSYAGNYGQVYGSIPTVGGYTGSITTGRRLKAVAEEDKHSSLFSSSVEVLAEQDDAFYHGSDAMVQKGQKLFAGGAKQAEDIVSEVIHREPRVFGAAARSLLQLGYGGYGGYGYGYGGYWNGYTAYFYGRR
ncbi:hypothetical protein WJX73_002622 [Symbiochloris irregularis]|uniref:Uncharacterized protein n=1 Tax=Symbiochloris irregularis TaxID=706552 RepID=A0AAW1P950_9CHLO